jgi:hypothetical protein
MPSSLRKAKASAENGNWSATVLRERTDHGGATELLTGCGENEPLVISVPLSSASSNHDIVFTAARYDCPRLSSLRMRTDYSMSRHDGLFAHRLIDCLPTVEFIDRLFVRRDDADLQQLRTLSTASSCIVRCIGRRSPRFADTARSCHA